MIKLLEQQYETSKDYDTLYYLVKVSRIVCFVNYGEAFVGGEYDGFQIRDVCQSNVRFTEYDNNIDIGCRGYSYIYARNKEDFIKQCIKKDLTYIIPTK
jgi:hypothetical protein